MSYIQPVGDYIIIYHDMPAHRNHSRTTESRFLEFHSGDLFFRYLRTYADIDHAQYRAERLLVYRI